MHKFVSRGYLEGKGKSWLEIKEVRKILPGAEGKGRGRKERLVTVVVRMFPLLNHVITEYEV